MGNRAGSSPVARTKQRKRGLAPLFLCFCSEKTGLEPIAAQGSGGALLPPVQTLAATIIFANGKNAYQVLSPVPYRVFITDLSYEHSIFLFSYGTI